MFIRNSNSTLVHGLTVERNRKLVGQIAVVARGNSYNMDARSKIADAECFVFAGNIAVI